MILCSIGSTASRQNCAEKEVFPKANNNYYSEATIENPLLGSIKLAFAINFSKIWQDGADLYKIQQLLNESLKLVIVWSQYFSNNFERMECNLLHTKLLLQIEWQP